MSHQSSPNTKKRIPVTLLWTLGLLVILLLWAGSYYYFSIYRTDLNWNEKGSLGDSFGAVNALFAGLAFLAVVITIYLQSRAIRQSRADIDLQSFENKFFQLIRVQNDILDGIVKYEPVARQHIPIKGRQRFKQLYDDFISYFEAEKRKTPQTEDAEIIERAYSALFKNYEHELGHYFRHLYNIVAFIDRSQFHSSIKQGYANLLRAQLSSSELLLLFYNCLWHKGKKKFKPLVEKYALLEHLPELKYTHHKSFYHSQAFQETQTE
ncbi:MAG TPA: putative phage abortive infection protein [Nitrososphaera sp.]|nr:putative phage abortive infection protein [Nitrososphaera sp.]